jgi:hypothetical protein
MNNDVIEGEARPLAIVQPKPPAYVAPRTFQDVQSIGRMMVASGFFKDIRSEAQACVKIIAGAARGYDPFTSMGAYHIIEGKLTESASEIASRIKRSGKYNYRVERLENTGCTLVFFEREDGAWEAVGKSDFSLEDAKAAGLAGKRNWTTYARNMMFARALTNGARWYCADIFGGAIYTPEELGAEYDAATDSALECEELPPAVAYKLTDDDRAFLANAQKRLAWSNGDLRDFFAFVLGDDRRSLEGATEDEVRAVKEGLGVRILDLDKKDVRERPSPTGANVAPDEGVGPPRPAEEPHEPGTLSAPDDGKMMRRLFVLLKERAGIESKPERLAFAQEMGIKVGSFSELTILQQRAMISRLEMIPPPKTP